MLTYPTTTTTKIAIINGLLASSNCEFQDLNNFDSDPEEFARTFCKDLGIEDPEVGVNKSNQLSTSPPPNPPPVSSYIYIS